MAATPDAVRYRAPPGLFDTLRRNQSYNVMDVGLFEIGRIFFHRQGQELPEERLSISGLLAGARSELSWHGKSEPVDFFDLKGLVEELLDGLNIREPRFEKQACPAYYDPAASARVVSGDRTLGWLGVRRRAACSP